MDAAIDEGAIRHRAYLIWEEEGRPLGREWDHWERALREIVEAAPPPAKPKPRKTAKSRIKAVLKSAMPN